MIQHALAVTRRWMKDNDHPITPIELHAAFEALARPSEEEVMTHDFSSEDAHHYKADTEGRKWLDGTRVYTKSEVQQRVREAIRELTTTGLYTEEALQARIKAEVDRVVAPLVEWYESEEAMPPRIKVTEVLKLAGKI